ncbi:ABC transporter ATP-binding protein [Oerskovia turbata]|uniref:ABC transporter ATP-binding protein n=1 Tax=Oerskovia turbata TaxID=1713 RepID=A0A4Q1L1T8_9CELL|nr:ABC transporter ATP-binding protein [Oerskovia turbata]RXR26945.1 ABC transporter ATP-binding protein [Oerskovia turbata]RXR36213.1 ABC transporter ATP-binding protein [Oerskovia turbata]TGJ95354.1 ABC transporter ATP-binding protein [Actinotalea fermentans ATCC 43279 = JCM 9966 = DSM 3133]
MSLTTTDLRVGYGRRDVLQGVDLEILQGELTVIVGPNGCGKSTLLLSLARVLRPTTGTVELDGQVVTSMPPREVAKQLAFLPQAPVGPDGIRVRDLVARGRHPHQGFLRALSSEDHRVIDEALLATDTLDLSTRRVNELSGGQRQRVWIAMALAQETSLLLLDEPTTFLDVAHQLDVLDTCARLHDEGRTVVAVLHDLNLAVRYATRLVLMKDGAVVAHGRPEEVLDADVVRHVFGIRAHVVTDPEGWPLVVPVRSDVLARRSPARTRAPHPAGGPA